MTHLEFWFRLYIFHQGETLKFEVSQFFCRWTLTARWEVIKFFLKNLNHSFAEPYNIINQSGKIIKHNNKRSFFLAGAREHFFTPAIIMGHHGDISKKIYHFLVSALASWPLISVLVVVVVVVVVVRRKYFWPEFVVCERGFIEKSRGFFGGSRLYCYSPASRL